MGKLVALMKRFVAWLEARFPIQCVVVKSDYDKLVADFNAMKTDSERLEAVVKDIKIIAAVVDVLKGSVENLIKKQELMERRPGSPENFSR